MNFESNDSDRLRILANVSFHITSILGQTDPIRDPKPLVHSY